MRNTRNQSNSKIHLEIKNSIKKQNEIQTKELVQILRGKTIGLFYYVFLAMLRTKKFSYRGSKQRMATISVQAKKEPGVGGECLLVKMFQTVRGNKL